MLFVIFRDELDIVSITENITKMDFSAAKNHFHVPSLSLLSFLFCIPSVVKYLSNNKYQKGRKINELTNVKPEWTGEGMWWC